MTTTPHRRYLPTVGSFNKRPPAPVVPLPTPPPSSVIAWAWYVNGVRKPVESMAVAARLACAGEGFVWLGLKDPKDEDLLALSSQFDLHPLAVEDAMHGHTRSKLEMFGDDLFMVISTVAYVDHEELTDTSEVVATGQVMVFLGDHFVITVRRGEHAQLSALRRSLEADPDRLARGPSEVLYAIADKIIDDYLGVVFEFEKDVDEIESAVFSRGGSHEVERVYQLKRELIEFKRCVMPLGAPLLRLATRELPVVPPEAKAYFRELADHHTEAREAVASFDEVLTSIMQAGLARASVADNEDMRKISAWVAIVAVPTMVAGIYGMNFDNMPELHMRYGYYSVLALIAALMVALYINFKRNRWLVMVAPLAPERASRWRNASSCDRDGKRVCSSVAIEDRRPLYPRLAGGQARAGASGNLLERTRAGAGHLREQFPGLGRDLVLAEHLVLRRHGLGDRGEVPLATGHRIPGGAEPDGQDDADRERHQQQGEIAGRLGEDQHHQPDEQSGGYARLQALGDHGSPVAPAKHPLDRLQFGADDRQILDLELLVRQVVDGLLGIGVGVEDPHRLGELQLEQRARLPLRQGHHVLHGGSFMGLQSTRPGAAVAASSVSAAEPRR